MAQPDPLVQRSLLLVDDDLTFQHHGELVFGRAGWLVVTASSGEEALAHLATSDFSLLVIDLRLPDMQGTDVLRQVTPGRLPPFFLISGFLDTRSTVDAAKLGAVDVLDKPFDIFELLERATEVVTARTKSMAMAAAAECPHSAAERWAHYVMLASDCPHDLPTLQAWAAFVKISYSGLRECCRLAGIPAQESRDFARMLRAVRHSMRIGCHPNLLLDVGDHRTLAGLFDRAGLPCGGSAMASPLQAFMTNQRLVAGTSLALRVLRGHLARLH